MVTIRFENRETEKLALGFLLGRFSGKVMKSGEHLVPEAALEALADQNEMLATGGRDRDRIDCIAAGDARGFWERIGGYRDDLKWCGSSPLYTFLKVCPEARGTLHHYQQWNIDPASVVTFAAMSFTA